MKDGKIFCTVITKRIYILYGRIKKCSYIFIISLLFTLLFLIFFYCKIRITNICRNIQDAAHIKEICNYG